MKRSRVTVAGALVAGIALGVLGTQVLSAQPSGIKRVVLLKTDLWGIDGREAIMGTAELAPGASAGKHYHHGQEIGYVLEGTAMLEVQGQPPVSLKTGDSYHIEASAPHDAKNTGSAAAKVLAIYLVEKGKPFAVPIP